MKVRNGTQLLKLLPVFTAPTPRLWAQSLGTSLPVWNITGLFLGAVVRPKHGSCPHRPTGAWRTARCTSSADPGGALSAIDPSVEIDTGEKREGRAGSAARTESEAKPGQKVSVE